MLFRQKTVHISYKNNMYTDIDNECMNAVFSSFSIEEYESGYKNNKQIVFKLNDLGAIDIDIVSPDIAKCPSNKQRILTAMAMDSVLLALYKQECFQKDLISFQTVTVNSKGQPKMSGVTALDLNPTKEGKRFLSWSDDIICSTFANLLDGTCTIKLNDTTKEQEEKIYSVLKTLLPETKASAENTKRAIAKR